MQLYEQVRIFTGDTIDALSDNYNKWMREQMALRAKIPMLAHTPLQVLDRRLTIKTYEGEETFALAVFYIHADLTDAERGTAPRLGDDVTGISAVPPQRIRTRRGS